MADSYLSLNQSPPGPERPPLTTLEQAICEAWSDTIAVYQMLDALVDLSVRDAHLKAGMEGRVFAVNPDVVKDAVHRVMIDGRVQALSPLEVLEQVRERLGMFGLTP